MRVPAAVVHLCFVAVAGLISGLAHAQPPDGVTIDPETGLWFPPCASPHVYLEDLDPAHSYGLDVKKAFSEDPQLAAAVCAAVEAWKSGESDPADVRVKMKKSMLSMLCSATAWERRAKEERETSSVKAREKLERFYAEAQAAPRFFADVQDGPRFPLVETLRDANTLPADERIRLGTRLLVAFPSNRWPVHFLLKYLRSDGSTLHNDSQRGVVEFFAARAEDPNASFDWLSAHRYALFFTGDYKGARKVMERIFAGPYASLFSYDPLFLAVLDRIDGRPENYNRLIKQCPQPSEEEISALYGYDDPEIHCRGWVDSLAAQALELSAGSPVLREIIREDASSRLLIVAVNAAYYEMQFDAESAKRHFERIALDASDVPWGIRADALLNLRKIALMYKDFDRAIQLIDCWFVVNRLDLVFPEDAWKRLAADPGVESLVESPQHEQNERLLAERSYAAAQRNDVGRMRQSIEMLLAFEIEAGGHLALVREQLLTLAMKEVDLGDLAAARRIRAFVAGQPLSETEKKRLSQLDEKLPRKARSGIPKEPWPRRSGKQTPPTSPGCSAKAVK